MELLVQGLLLCLLSAAAGNGVAAAAGKAKVPALYVFGDSTVDVGNNNYLPGSAVPRANFPHYGVDFPRSRPTGRFSNGYNVADFISKVMGHRRSPPAYLSLTPKMSHQMEEGVRGVNYASAGSGILDSTRRGIIIPLSKQIEYFAATKSRIEAKEVGLVSKSLFVVSVGGNDLFAFAAQHKAANSSQVAKFLDDLIATYANHIEALYRLGARMFAILDVGPVGCVPSARVLSPTGGCIESMNNLSLGFNDALRALLTNLSSKLDGMKYSLGGSYALMSYIIANPHTAGFKEVKSACCGEGRLGAEGKCLPNSTYCQDRSQYLFWDSVHASQAASKIGALAMYSGPLKFVAPVTLEQLVKDCDYN